MKKFDCMGFYRILVFAIFALLLIHPSLGRDYYVSVNGNDGSGDGSASKPFRTLRHACSRVPANQGHRIVLSAGTFVESGRCVVPSGVSVIGAGIDQTYITANSSLYRSVFSGYDANLFVLYVRGNNQRISGFTLDGRDKNIYGGLMVQHSQNIEVDNVYIKEFYFCGIWLWETRNSTFHDSRTFDCSWASTGWAGGGVHLFNLTDVRLYNLDCKEIAQRNGKGGGNAIKAIGGENNRMTRVVLDNVKADVNDFGVWQNGRAPNISIEFWHTVAEECEIRNTYVQHHMSLVGKRNPPLPPDRFRWRLLNNRIICRNSYPIEISYNNVEMAYNYIDANGYGYNICNWEREGERYENWYIHDNIIEEVGNWGWPTSLIQSRGGLRNVRFYNNTIYLKGAPVGVISLYGPNSSQDVYIENNIFYRSDLKNANTEPSRDLLVYAKTSEGIHRINNVYIRGNIFKDFPQDVSTSHVANVIKSGNRVGNPGLNFSGAKPYPFYSPTSSGLAQQINAGARPADGLPAVPTIPTGDTNNPVNPTPVDPVLLDLPIRINTGGGEYTSPEGDVFLADVNHFGSTRTAEYPLVIDNTNKSLLYQSERWGENFEYKFSVPNGTYDVTLHFAEIYWEGEERRVFDVNIEGENKLSDFDIFQEAGNNTAIVSEFTDIAVTDSVLEIDFLADIDNAKISAIEVIAQEPNTPPSFTVDKKELFLTENFEGSYAIEVTPDEVPIDERDQVVTYSVSPTENLIANVEIDEQTGWVTITAIEDKWGSQDFAIIADDGEPDNNISMVEFTINIEEDGHRIIPIEEEGVIVRINAGGEAFTTESGVEFSADDVRWLGGTSRTFETEGEIDATNDDTIYLSERWGEAFSYNILIPNGSYDVILHFAEIYWKGPEYRIFNVNIEGEEVDLANLDIFSEVGYFNALSKKFDQIKVEDGEINLEFEALKDNAKLSAIEIVNTIDEDKDSTSSASVRINCGGEELDVEGFIFLADTLFSEKTMVWYNGVVDDILNTEFDELYRSERYADTDMGTYSYNIPLEDGDYVVFFHMAEIYFGVEGGLPNQNQEGIRKMYAKLEGEQVFKDLDLIALEGPSSAYILEVPVTVSDGTLNIEMGASRNRPKLSAIEILPEEDADLSISNIDMRESFRINCGGPEVTVLDEYTFIADTFFSQHSLQWRNVQLENVASTPFDELFLTERYANENRGAFNYSIPVENGEYVLFLHFAEIYFGAEGGSPEGTEGMRRIEITAEDQQVISNLDLIKEVGTSTAYVKEIPIVVSDGMLNINFTATANRPKISAIEILIPSEVNNSISKIDMRPSLRINCGSDEPGVFNGYEFMADEYFTQSSRSWKNEGLSDVTGTSHDDLYLTERYSDQDLGDFAYQVPVENGNYVVYIHFAEIYFGAEGGVEEGVPGMRQFDVFVEGEEIIDALDLIDLVGSARAYAKEVKTTVRDGILDIELVGIKNRPKISAIEILIPNDAETSISKATNTNRLQEEADHTITIEPSLISLAPNPATHNTRLMIDDESWEGSFGVTLYDASGRSVRQFTFDKNRSMGTYDIDLRELIPGFYVVTLYADNVKISKKLWIY